jgi:polysaccharide pyruvyl transferase WcaK-like protein
MRASACRIDTIIVIPGGLRQNNRGQTPIFTFVNIGVCPRFMDGRSGQF